MTNAIERNRNIMKRAWEISREAVTKYGGKVVQFFAESLRQAWQEFESIIAQVVNLDMYSRIKALKSMKIMAEELAEEIKTVENSIKAELDAQGVTKLIVQEFKVYWTPYTSSKVDTTALKKELPDIAVRFTKTTENRRFSIA
jgi:predicted phage-related endonuclease